MLGAVIDPASFKAYDVRGIYPTQLDEEGAYAIGRAFVDQFSPTTIAVGRDMRVSGVTMAEARPLSTRFLAITSNERQAPL